MPGPQDKHQILKDYNVVPDVLLDGSKLSYDMKIKWPNAVLDTLGKELDREDTQPEPLIYLDPTVLTFYILRRLLERINDRC